MPMMNPTMWYKKKARNGNSMRYMAPTPEEMARGMPMKANDPKRTCNVELSSKVETLNVPLEDTEAMTEMHVRRVIKQMTSTPIKRDTQPQHVWEARTFILRDGCWRWLR
jgi:hypothetical protein